jgi:Lrp/AsnC family transcriptional regulator, leucine-responsive regulatory protein
MTLSNQLDAIDKSILKEVQIDGRLSIVELAARVNLSKSPCLKRLRRLENEGYIKGYYAELDAKKLSCGHLVFVQVKLSNTTRSKLEDFNRAVQHVPQVLSCHMMSGGYDYLLKVRTRDMDEYRILMGDILSALPSVGQTSTFAVMEEVKDTMVLPFDQQKNDAVVN